jgi:CoA-transferase family III
MVKALGLEAWEETRNQCVSTCARKKEEGIRIFILCRPSKILYQSVNGHISLVKKLAEESDVLIENFKPGTMEKWGLGPGKNPLLLYCCQ